MEKGNIKIVEIADFKNSEHVLDYVDNDFVIINSLEGSPYNEDTIRLGCFLIAICLEGCIQLDVNYKTYQLEAGDLLLGLPNTIISHAMVSPKHKIRLAAFSTQFLQRVDKMEKDTRTTVMHIHNNPIKSVWGGRGQGYLQNLPRTAYGKDKRRASSLSQGSDAILVFCHFL
mgnify:CR=1 FL=1